MRAGSVERIKDISAGRPCIETWSALRQSTDEIESSDTLTELIEFADDHLTSWPDEERVSPRTWSHNVLSRFEEPRFRLVRYAGIGEQALANSRHLGNLARLNILEEVSGERVDVLQISSTSPQLSETTSD